MPPCWSSITLKNLKNPATLTFLQSKQYHLAFLMSRYAGESFQVFFFQKCFISL